VSPVNEVRRTPSSALAALIELGPSDTAQVAEFLWPGGTTRSRTHGQETRMRNPRIKASEKLTRLALDGLAVERGTVWEIAPRSGRVWVVYVATRRILAGVYDANVRVVSPLVDRPLPLGSESQPRLRDLIQLGMEALAEAVVNTPASLRSAAGVSIGLPAGMDPGGTNTTRFNPQRWGELSVADEAATTWRRLQSRPPWREAALPDLPLLDGEPAVCVDSDVVLDTLAAMYPRLSGRLEEHLVSESSVLGVKHSGGVRATLISRGERLHGAGDERPPGRRRDLVFRGASGDTVGLGHTVALADVAALEAVTDLPGFQNARSFADLLRRQRRACSCGETQLVHLDGLVTADRLAERLGIRDYGLGLHGLIKEAHILANTDSAEGTKATLVLEETGALLAHAIDLASRLYDPAAIFVTGTLPHSDVVWTGLSETFKRLSPAGRTRPLWRSPDIEGTDAEADPIGPRGAAWLALDTFVYPELVRRARQSSRNGSSSESTGHQPVSAR